MNRAAFYKSLKSTKSSLFGKSLGQRQVTGMEALLDAGAGLSLDHMANVLSQVHHETGGGMYPVKETVFRSSKNQNPTDKQVIARLDRAWKKGQLPWVKRPYWRDGWFGRGGIQITHKDNYRRGGNLIGRDLVAHRDLALDPVISAKLAVEGMRTGLYRKFKLADFDKPGGYDHAGARNIVNGDTRKIGPKIAANARSFRKALTAAGWGKKRSVKPAKPVRPQSPANPPKRGLWASLARALRGLFGRKGSK